MVVWVLWVLRVLWVLFLFALLDFVEVGVFECGSGSVGVCVEMCINTGGSKLVNWSNLITNWGKPLLYNQLGITFTL